MCYALRRPTFLREEGKLDPGSSVAWWGATGIARWHRSRTAPLDVKFKSPTTSPASKRGPFEVENIMIPLRKWVVAAFLCVGLALSTQRISAAVRPDGSLHGLFDDEKAFASTNALATYCERKQVHVEIDVVGTDHFEYCFVSASPYAGSVKVHLFVLVRIGDNWQLYLTAGLTDCFAGGLKFKANGKHVDIYDHYDELLLEIRHPTPPQKPASKPPSLPAEDGK
jgi:hypothetical protein